MQKLSISLFCIVQIFVFHLEIQGFVFRANIWPVTRLWSLKTAGSSSWWLTPRTQTQAQRKYLYETAVINLGFRHLGHLGFRIFRRSESVVTKGLQSEL